MAHEEQADCYLGYPGGGGGVSKPQPSHLSTPTWVGLQALPHIPPPPTSPSVQGLHLHRPLLLHHDVLRACRDLWQPGLHLRSGGAWVHQGRGSRPQLPFLGLLHLCPRPLGLSPPPRSPAPPHDGRQRGGKLSLPPPHGPPSWHLSGHLDRDGRVRG